MLALWWIVAAVLRGSWRPARVLVRRLRCPCPEGLRVVVLDGYAECLHCGRGRWL